MKLLYTAIVLLPLAGALLAGLAGRAIGRAGAHWAAILGVAGAFVLSLLAAKRILLDGQGPDNITVYQWLLSDGIRFQVGFLVDRLTVLMMLVVTFVSLMVHIYTIGYMADDPGYQRFFAYIALFTFSMLMLVMANNFMQLFFGWEAVGVVSYLLIGFWYTRESAIFANLKAFLVNRVGDFGFLLGIAGVLWYAGTLDYAPVFDWARAGGASGKTIEIIAGHPWEVMTLICLLLFVGAMGKSAQVPLHVWLPDSMEGPTPISALIHAATMVTAGIFMVARMSPLFELSETALSAVMVIGAITAFFMGLLGLVQNDIKRVVAYSTLSQLGYMTVALGASAYAAAIFHLMTHAFFKALLFLAAGSVIIAMHHEQDMRRMGGLRKYLPITYWTSLVGSLALIGFPGFSGFFSKDAIIEAVHHSSLPGASLAYWAVLLGVFVTALYSFRMFFLTFHGSERFATAAGDPGAAHGAKGHDAAHGHDHGHGQTSHGDDAHHGHGGTPHESPWVVTVPLILLAVPSVLIGLFTVGPVLFGGYFHEAIRVLPGHDVLAALGKDYHGVLGFIAHGLMAPPFWLAAAGVFTAWWLYMKQPALPAAIRARAEWLYQLLLRKYGFDDLYQHGFAAAGRLLGRMLWKAGDAAFIDGLMVNGSARVVAVGSRLLRHIQTGYLYHYAFVMIAGIALLLFWFVVAPAQGWRS